MSEAKGKKLRRVSKLKPYYKAQYGKTDANKKRKLGKHIRYFPEDVKAQKRYDELYHTGAAGHAANAKGRAVGRSRRIADAARHRAKKEAA